MTAELETRPGTARTGAGRRWIRAWRAVVPAVLAQALIQGVLVLPDPVPGWSVRFLLLVLASLATVVLATWLLAGATTAEGARRPVPGMLRRPAVAGWVLALGAAAVAATLLWLYLVPVVLLVGAFLLPAVAAGDRPATTFRPFRRRPGAALLVVLLGLVLIALGWGLALLLGLFVTGAVAAALTWLWFGLAGSFLLCAGAAVRQG